MPDVNEVERKFKSISQLLGGRQSIRTILAASSAHMQPIRTSALDMLPVTDS